MGYLNELLSRNPLVIDGGTIRPHHNYTDDLYTGGKITMTNEEAINILKQNAICSPKATGFNRAVEVVTNEINRQNAEIERLKHRKTELQIRNQELQHEKSEAIKEFAERLKECCYTYSDISGYQSTVIDIAQIDNLVQEMVGNADV